MLLVWYYGDKKEGYFVDELWSYGLANSTEYRISIQYRDGIRNGRPQSTI